MKTRTRYDEYFKEVEEMFDRVEKECAGLVGVKLHKVFFNIMKNLYDMNEQAVGENDTKSIAFLDKVFCNFQRTYAKYNNK